jgi:uncharacterized protein (TIGR02246 family)
LNTTQEHVAEILALDESWKIAAGRHDIDGMMAIYATDAQELLPGIPPIVGVEAIRAFYEGVMDAFPRFAHAFTMEEIVVSDSADLAVVRGSYRFTADTDEPAAVQVGKFIGVWRRRAGQWRLQFNISNSNAAA